MHSLGVAQQRLLLSLAITVMCASCARRPRALPATTEGPRYAVQPILARPARLPSAALSARHEAGLVLFVPVGHPPVEVQLFPNAVWRDVIRTDTVRTGKMIVWRGLAPQLYTGVVRRVGSAPQLFRVLLSPGYVDTLELELGQL